MSNQRQIFSVAMPDEILEDLKSFLERKNSSGSIAISRSRFIVDLIDGICKDDEFREYLSLLFKREAARAQDMSEGSADLNEQFHADMFSQIASRLSDLSELLTASPANSVSSVYLSLLAHMETDIRKSEGYGK